MDPVTALGAAGSVIGIAGFALQLYASICQFYSNLASAPEELAAILEGLGSTEAALRDINELLKKEEQHEKEGKGRLLFSKNALKTIKDTSSKCLLVFWRIEGTITGKGDSKSFEEGLRRRLEEFNEKLRNHREPPVIALDEDLAKAATPYYIRLTWAVKGVVSKLQGYCEQLHKFQQTLVLMFLIISLHAQLEQK